jgi:hypothetical protein
MCPACLTTTALAVAGVTSAGGLTTLAVAKLRARNAAKRGDLAIATSDKPELKGAQDGPSPNRVAR